MDLLVNEPNATGAVNSDIAFWGKRAYVGDYAGFRIFDISDPANPALLSDFVCFGPQNDPVVWENKLLFLAIDRALAGPECGSPAVAHDDPTGWEGVRIFDVSDPRNPKFIKGVYTDCGAHTITLFPKNPAQILLYVLSYPLRPGPTCGQVRGPEAGRDPLHGVIQVIRVPVNNPKAAKEIAEPRSCTRVTPTTSSSGRSTGCRARRPSSRRRGGAMTSRCSSRCSWRPPLAPNRASCGGSDQTGFRTRRTRSGCSTTRSTKPGSPAIRTTRAWSSTSSTRPHSVGTARW